MSSIKRLFKHTLVYGLATVLPRLLTVLLTPLLIEYLPSQSAFGEVSLVFSWIIVFNVLLTYGMETSFFRFFSDPKETTNALGTSIITLLITTLVFVVIAFLGIEYIAAWTDIAETYWKWVIGVLAFDTLMVIPFAYMRAQGKSMKYAVVKLINVIISTGTAALFFIWLPEIDFLNKWLPTDKIELFFIALFGASAITFMVICRPYFLKLRFDQALWKKMMRYGFPILIAGLAFAINETFDKILLQWMTSPEESPKDQVGIYTACYRLAIGMTLFATAFKLGVEPFFFSESRDKNATKMYAQITKMFVVLGSIAMFVYIVLVDLIKPLLVTKEAYWVAMDVVPLVVFAFFFFGIYQTLSVWYKVTDKTKYGAYISIVGAILTIVFNVVFIPKIGYMASAIATCAAYGLMMVLSYLIGRKHMAIPYDIKNILLYMCLSILFSSIFFYILRDYFGIGSLPLYLVGTLMSLVLIGIIGYREQTFIKSLLKRK